MLPNRGISGNMCPIFCGAASTFWSFILSLALSVRIWHSSSVRDGVYQLSEMHIILLLMTDAIYDVIVLALRPSVKVISSRCHLRTSRIALVQFLPQRDSRRSLARQVPSRSRSQPGGLGNKGPRISSLSMEKWMSRPWRPFRWGLTRSSSLTTSRTGVLYFSVCLSDSPTDSMRLLTVGTNSQEVNEHILTPWKL